MAAKCYQLVDFDVAMLYQPLMHLAGYFKIVTVSVTNSHRSADFSNQYDTDNV